MKKLLVVAIILGVGGYFAYAKVLRPAPKRACDRLAELCDGSQRSHDDDKSCTDFFDEVGKSGGDESGKTASCVLEAKSCAEAIGCTAGGAVKVGAGVAKSFLDGFQKSVK
ncbi:MAG TPA: hypothetical protein VGL86_07400 [Polyangia bacterium]